MRPPRNPAGTIDPNRDRARAFCRWNHAVRPLPSKNSQGEIPGEADPAVRSAAPAYVVSWSLSPFHHSRRRPRDPPVRALPPGSFPCRRRSASVVTIVTASTRWTSPRPGGGVGAFAGSSWSSRPSRGRRARSCEAAPPRAFPSRCPPPPSSNLPPNPRRKPSRSSCRPALRSRGRRPSPNPCRQPWPARTRPTDRRLPLQVLKPHRRDGPCRPRLPPGKELPSCPPRST